MVKIALISLYGVENTGIRSIASELRQNGFTVSEIFFKRWSNNDIQIPSRQEADSLIRVLKSLDISLVGLSFTSPFLNIAQQLSRKIKSEVSALLVCGGNHATVDPKSCLEFCDLVCRGEGEETMIEIARAVSQGNDLKGIRNTCWSQSGKTIREPLRPLIRDLDKLSPLVYGGANKFFIEKKVSRLDPLILSRELRVFASRGCPFSCSYCYNSMLRRLYQNENYHRIRSVESVIQEIEQSLKVLTRVRKIKFDDDTFVFPRYWIEEFCEQYRKRIGLPFDILYRADCLDPPTLRRLRQAGLSGIQVGIQSASEQESEQVFERKLVPEKLFEFAGLARALRLNVTYDLIFDNPLSGTTEKERLLWLMLKLPRPFNIFMYSLTVFPGTRLQEILLEKKLISAEQVEGRAQKSFEQFRLSFSYPRSKEELFHICLVSLTSKSFVPHGLIRRLSRSGFLRQRPTGLRWMAEACNLIKLLQVGLRMIWRGELSFWKLKEYGSGKRYLIQ